MKTDFKPFRVGTIFNPIRVKIKKVKPVYRYVKIKFPSRLNAMAIDPSKIATNKNLVYTPGEVVFSVAIFKNVRVEILENQQGRLEISEISKRKSLIKHAYLLMKQVLKFREGLHIDVDNINEFRHCGLGSSSGLIAAVACAINEIYGRPINDVTLVRYLAQNHGEEIENDENFINPVQCIGGSAAAGIFEGGLLIIAGDSCVVKTMNILSCYQVIIGIPSDFKQEDSMTMLRKEIKNLKKFKKTGEKFGPQIAYNILHKVLPSMEKGDLATIGDVIYDYRFNMGSIKNCSFVYPKLVSLTNKLAFLKKKGITDVLSISSVGPGIFAITKNKNRCLEVFKKVGLKTITTKIENNKYKIVKNKCIKKQLVNFGIPENKL